MGKVLVHGLFNECCFDDTMIAKHGVLVENIITLP